MPSNPMKLSEQDQKGHSETHERVHNTLQGILNYSKSPTNPEQRSINRLETVYIVSSQVGILFLKMFPTDLKTVGI